MAYAFKRTLTVDHTQCGSSDSTNFPVLFSFTDTTMKLVGSGGHINNTTTSNGQTVCADLAFYSDSALTTKLNWEIEFYDGTAGTVIAWVQVGTLSHTADTVFYMAYDDASVTTFQGNVNGTWDGNYLAVYHVPNGSSLSLNDSTSNASTLGSVGTAPTAIAGQIDGAISVGGAGYAEAVDLGSRSAGTIQTWLYSTNAFNDGQIHGWWGENLNGAGGAPEISGQKYLDGNMYVGWNLSGNDERVVVAASSLNYPTATWIKMDYTWSVGGNGIFYLAGASVGTHAVSAVAALTSEFAWGARGGNAPFFTGRLDEMRLSSSARSSDWIAAEYNNQKSASTFLTVGSETPISGAFTTGRSYFL